MWDWYRRMFSDCTLQVMRLTDMQRVHPLMDSSHVCSQCGELVGIYPSGQHVLRRYRRVKIICNRCQPVPRGMLAPGALQEPFESHWKD